jgi:hypothetical protein
VHVEQILLLRLTRRQFAMGILADVAVTGEVLGAWDDAAAAQTAHEGEAIARDVIGSSPECAIADYFARRIRKYIEHRREVDVETGRTQFTAHRCGQFLDLGRRMLLRQNARRLESHEWGPETDDAPALLINCKQRRRVARAMDCAAQADQLIAAFVIALEEDDHARRQPLQGTMFARRKLRTSEADAEEASS